MQWWSIGGEPLGREWSAKASQKKFCVSWGLDNMKEQVREMWERVPGGWENQKFQCPEVEKAQHMRGTAGEWSRSAEKHITLVLPTRRLRQKDCHELLASMGYRARPYLKNQNKAVEWKGKDKLRDIGVMSEPASGANCGFYLKCHEQLFVSVCMCVCMHVRAHVHGVCLCLCMCEWTSVRKCIFMHAHMCVEAQRWHWMLS